MPHLLSSKNWIKTGRWDSIGRELIRVKDHKSHEYCLAPTHEECITDIVGISRVTWKNLPLRLYQIGTKFRDEMRPRHGLMRAKEFIMKDLYSFDKTQEEAYVSYQTVYDAYCRIFQRMALNYIAVDADTGNIGGTKSHEFQIVSEAGEDTILQCECCKYGANVEKAMGIRRDLPKSDFYVRVKYTDKVIEYRIESGKDRTPNLLRIKSELGAEEVELIKSSNDSLTLVDKSVFENGSGFFTHAEAGDGCPKGCLDKKLVQKRGIEVGHVFYLGKRYSSALAANYVTSEQKSEVIEMGCYGIGVSRVLQSIVETSNDAKGIIWPLSVAPYRICVISVQDEYLEDAIKIAKELEKIPLLHKEIIVDDRSSKLPIKVRDAKLLGFPYILLVGKQSREYGTYELTERSTLTEHKFTPQQLINHFTNTKL